MHQMKAAQVITHLVKFRQFFSCQVSNCLSVCTSDQVSNCVPDCVSDQESNCVTDCGSDQVPNSLSDSGSGQASNSLSDTIPVQDELVGTWFGNELEDVEVKLGEFIELVLKNASIT